MTRLLSSSENIFGYRDLKVLVMLSAAGMQAYVTQYSGEPIDPGSFPDAGDMKADEVLPPIVKLMADGQVCKSLGEFRNYLLKEEPKFKPLGEKIHEWEAGAAEGRRHFEVYRCDHSVPGFLDYHKRLQPWIMYYIDAASYIDSDDPNWLYFVM